MQRSELADLGVFLAVAETGSFTKAASRLGTSQSSVSQTIRKLEGRLGVRLLARTTRSVAVTDAGAHLLVTLQPAFDDIASRISTLSSFRDKPSGIVRITCNHHAAKSVLWPAISGILWKYPDIRMELATDALLTDIIADRFDAGVRVGPQIGCDMTTVRIGPDLRMAVVGAPDYFRTRSVPETPRDLSGHVCINLWLATVGEVAPWDFRRGRAAVRMKVNGPLLFNDMSLIMAAAKAGHGLARVMEDEALPEIEAGNLVRVLEDWCPWIPGYHLYYPNRRELSPAFAAVVDELRAGGRIFAETARTNLAEWN